MTRNATPSPTVLANTAQRHVHAALHLSFDQHLSPQLAHVHDALQQRIQSASVSEVAKPRKHIDVVVVKQCKLRVSTIHLKALHCLMPLRFFAQLAVMSFQD